MGLAFRENGIVVAHPSKSGGDWWYGRNVSTGKRGLFPKTYVEIVKPCKSLSSLFILPFLRITNFLIDSAKAKALYDYVSGNSDELGFSEGDILSIVDKTEGEWWKAEKEGLVYIVPASYMEEVVEG